jgi:TatD DNase family protein
MPLIDSHAHLDFADYGQDLDGVVERARAAGLVHVVLIGQYREGKGGIDAAREALELSRRDRTFFSATAGIHPHDAGPATDADLETLREICALPEIAAVGECGLDFHYDRSPREQQRDRFARQVRLAAALGKPVVVHSREADVETAEVLREHLGPDGGVIHCFTSDWTAARRYLDLGLYISLAGVMTFKNAEPLRDAAAKIPLDRLLVETDSPFLAPIPHRGKRNEPAFVRHTALRLAELRKLPIEAIEEATTENARRALRLPSGAPSQA